MAMAEAASKRLSREECEAKARECRDLAQRSLNPEHRTMLEHMAETWERVIATFRDSKKLQ